MQQINLFGEKMKLCPKCSNPIRVWIVIDKLYGYCNKCVEGFYFENEK